MTEPQKVKNFLICKGSPAAETAASFCEIRLAMERLFGQSGHRINHFTINYCDNGGKYKTKSSAYKAELCHELDTLSIHDCRMIMFSGIVADLSIQNMSCSSIVLPVENDVLLKFVWCGDTSMQADFLESVETAQKHIRRGLHIEYLTAGCMEASKNVEMFVQGILSDSRTEYENRIAKAIQTSTYLDKKIPFLFPYTFYNKIDPQGDVQTASGKALYFSDLVNASLDTFSKNGRWHQWNRTLKESGMLVM